MKTWMMNVTLVVLGVAAYLGLNGYPEPGPSSSIHSSQQETADPIWKSVSRQSPAELDRSLDSFRKLADHPFYEMTYFGNYGASPKPTETRLETTDQAALQRMPSWGCSLFVSVGKDGQAIYGRNFDWQHNPAMLLHTHPDDGYASVSMVDISYLGFEKDDPKLDTAKGRQALLYAPMIPFDGMNECGLTVGMAAVSDTKFPHAAEKPSVGGLQIIRLVLDGAQTVDEAVEIFRQNNIVISGGPCMHYLVADRFGKSVLIEMKDGKMHCIPGKGNWQSATNFYLTEESKPLQQCNRFASIDKIMTTNEGVLDHQQAMELLERIKQANTQWSVVYDLKLRTAKVCVSRKFDRSFDFQVTSQRKRQLAPRAR